MKTEPTNSRVLLGRRVVLILAAIVFAAISVASLVAPHRMAEAFDYKLATNNSLSEYRAIHVGLWLAHAAVLAWAARRIELLHLGDVAGVLILGQVIGRLASLLLDGPPDLRLAPVAIAELLAGLLIFALRPWSISRQ